MDAITITTPAGNTHVAPVGCLIDGWWGQYAGDRLCDIALALDWGDQLDDDDLRVAQRAAQRAAQLHDWDGDDAMLDRFVDLADRAADYIDSLLPDGYSAGWWDGEFHIQPTGWWKENS